MIWRVAYVDTTCIYAYVLDIHTTYGYIFNTVIMLTLITPEVYV